MNNGSLNKIEKEYVLGTHDEEIERLGLQHRVWRPRALDAWRRAGFNVGHTVLDLGCGPGYCSIDLAEIVGRSGRVIGVDVSGRFVEAARALADQRQLKNIDFHELDICTSALPEIEVDGIWTRWVFCFLKEPEKALRNAVSLLKPGGTIVVHEYFCYSTWQTMPPSKELTEFVDLVKKSWIAEGGDPDIGLRLVPWMGELDLEIMDIRPIVDVVGADNFVWQWPTTFLNNGINRLAEKDHISYERASYLKSAIEQNQSSPDSKLVTPALLEITARRRK